MVNRTTTNERQMSELGPNCFLRGSVSNQTNYNQQNQQVPSLESLQVNCVSIPRGLRLKLYTSLPTVAEIILNGKRPWCPSDRARCDRFLTTTTSQNVTAAMYRGANKKQRRIWYLPEFFEIVSPRSWCDVHSLMYRTVSVRWETHKLSMFRRRPKTVTASHQHKAREDVLGLHQCMSDMECTLGHHSVHEPCRKKLYQCSTLLYVHSTALVFELPHISRQGDQLVHTEW